MNRRRPIPKRRAKPRRSARRLDPQYLADVRRLPCCVGMDCWGQVEADHAGQRPVGRKADDDTAIPMCRRHHQDRTDARGIFYGLQAGEMRRWCQERIEETRTTITAQRAGVGGVQW